MVDAFQIDAIKVSFDGALSSGWWVNQSSRTVSIITFHPDRQMTLRISRVDPRREG